MRLLFCDIASAMGICEQFKENIYLESLWECDTLWCLPVNGSFFSGTQMPFCHHKWIEGQSRCIGSCCQCIGSMVFWCDRWHWCTQTVSHCHSFVLSTAAWQRVWFQFRWRCPCRGGLVPLSGCVCMQLIHCCWHQMLIIIKWLSLPGIVYVLFC